MKKLSDDEFEQRIQHMRELYLENHDKSELKTAMAAKLSFLDRFRSRDNQKARLRRQLSELEINDVGRLWIKNPPKNLIKS